MIEKDGKWYERCGDCGEAVLERKISGLTKVCDECWERRGWLVDNAGKYSKDGRFQKIQRSMGYHSGTAKKQIIKLQQEEGANIAFSIDNFADSED